MKNSEKEEMKAVVLKTVKTAVPGIKDREVMRILMSLYIDLSGRRKAKGGTNA